MPAQLVDNLGLRLTLSLRIAVMNLPLNFSPKLTTLSFDRALTSR